MDATISLHPFFMHRLDVGPICLKTIAHAFNYRVAVLRDGVKLAARVGRSRRAAERILEDIGIPWGHQVAVMLQIVCALALEVPSVLRDIESLHGVSPNDSLSCEPWGHIDHTGRDCACLSSDSTGAYVHDLSLATKEASPVEEREDLSTTPSGAPDEPATWRGRVAPGIGAICVSSARHLWPPSPGCVRAMEDGHFSGVCWLRPVTRGGGGGLAGCPTSHRALCG